MLTFRCRKLFKNITIPKLPVFTTEEGIKQIKNNLDKIIDWKNINRINTQFLL